MAMKLPEEDLKLLALFVHRNKITKEDAKSAIDIALKMGLSLEEVLLKNKLISPREWDEWKRGGGKLPELKGYKIIKKLGEGGSSIVYLAEDEKNKKIIALKVLRKDLKVDEKSFIKEGKLLIKIKHPNIVRAYKLAQQKDLLYLVMEFIEGETALDRLLKGKKFNEEEAINTILSISKALEHLEKNGIVHRDVKPGNIMVPRRGEAKLIDLGLAVEKGYVQNGESIAGTPYYISPEQAKGDFVDQRSDIYSLGVSLFHMVTGELPFEGSDKREVMRAHMEKSLSSKALKERTFTPLIAYFIKKMTAKEKEIRYQRLSDLIEDLEKKIKGYREFKREGRVERPK